MTENNPIRYYIIGSMSQADDIKVVAECLENKGIFVNYVFPKEEALEKLDSDCLDQIEKADVIFAICKPDFTFGESVTYEIAYAKKIGKKIIKIFL